MSAGGSTRLCKGSGTTVGCFEKGAEKICPECRQKVATTGWNALKRTAKLRSHRRPA